MQPLHSIVILYMGSTQYCSRTNLFLALAMFMQSDTESHSFLLLIPPVSVSL